MMTALEFFRLRVQALTLTKLSQIDNDIIEHFLVAAKEMEKQQMSDAFYAPANLVEPKNFDEYYKQKYEDEKANNHRSFSHSFGGLQKGRQPK